MWEEKTDVYVQECLSAMRGIIPPDIFTTSSQDMERLGLSASLVKRLNTKKCLWLIRMDAVQINKLHEAELLGKYNYAAQNLDIVETAAIYGALPKAFTLDSSGNKSAWRDRLAASLRQMITQKDNGSLSPAANRNPVYKDVDSEKFLARETLFSHEQVVISAEDESEIYLREREQAMASTNPRRRGTAPVCIARTESSEWVSETCSPLSASMREGLQSPKLFDSSSSPCSHTFEAESAALDHHEASPPLEVEDQPREGALKRRSVAFIAIHEKLSGINRPSKQPESK